MTADQPFDASQPLSLENALLLPRIVIESTAPVIEGGQFAVKSVVGQILTIATKVYADGHDKLAVRVRWRAAAAGRCSRRRWSARSPSPRCTATSSR